MAAVNVQSLPPVLRVRAVLVALVALSLLAFVGCVYGVSSGRLDYALFTASLLYMMGLTQGGVAFCAVMRLTGAQWSKPYYRLAELCTAAFAPFALLGFLLLFVFGRDELFYWLHHVEQPDAHLSAWLDIGWLFVRDLAGLLIFYGVSIVYVIVSIRQDTDAGSDPERAERALFLLSPCVLLAFVLCGTLFAWDFSMMLIEHWHSSVFPILFTFENLFAGTAALVWLVALFRWSGTASPFEAVQVRSLGMILLGFAMLWLYLFWAQFFVVWFGNLPRETDALWPQMTGNYAPYFWSMLSGCFFVPFVVLLFAPAKRSVLVLSVLALGINVGVWLHKFLTVAPAFTPDARPFSAWINILVAAGLLAGFLATLIVAVRRVPVFARAEMARGGVGTASLGYS